MIGIKLGAMFITAQYFDNILTAAKNYSTSGEVRIMYRRIDEVGNEIDSGYVTLPTRGITWSTVANKLDDVLPPLRAQFLHIHDRQGTILFDRDINFEHDGEYIFLLKNAQDAKASLKYFERVHKKFKKVIDKVGEKGNSAENEGFKKGTYAKFRDKYVRSKDMVSLRKRDVLLSELEIGEFIQSYMNEVDFNLDSVFMSFTIRYYLIREKNSNNSNNE